MSIKVHVHGNINTNDQSGVSMIDIILYAVLYYHHFSWIIHYLIMKRNKYWDTLTTTDAISTPKRKYRTLG